MYSLSFSTKEKQEIEKYVELMAKEFSTAFTDYSEGLFIYLYILTYVVICYFTVV